jgi:integrase
MPAFRPLNPDTEPTVNAGPPPSLLRLTEDLILTKATGKSDGWEPKTANQHRSIVKLLVKIAGTDDPRDISQTHIGKYFSTLAVIPKHYGKSSKDEGRSIEEILARAEELEDEDIGLEAGTINRHQTQLGNILSHLKGNGFQCGQAFPSFRRPETESPDEKRSPFSVEEGQTFFANPVYTGCKGDEARLEVGPLIIHDALYWIRLIAWYGLMRLSEIAGLMLTDIDFQARAFIVADSQIRRIKTPQSKRRVPFHPELIRLGLLDYLSEINRLGYDVVFPDLKLRGVKTPMGALFYKVFRPALDQALPHASQQRITLHSTRKTGNTAMIAGKVIDPTRHRVMGHQIPGVNGRHYTAPLPDEVLLEALMHIPVVTHGVRCSPIRLASGLKNVNEVPTSK